MFPTSHNISPFYLGAAVLSLLNILRAGNKVLIVTKPHRECIQRLCEELTAYKDQILFRFTITTLDRRTASYWEPGAPDPAERLECLIYAFNRGYQTSISAEPLLGGAATGIELFRAVAPYVTDQVWFGKLNDPWRRVLEIDVLPDCRQRTAAIEKAQRPFITVDLYNALKSNPKAAWKDSIKKDIEKYVKEEKGE